MSIILAINHCLQTYLPQPKWTVCITRSIEQTKSNEILIEYYCSTPSTEHEITISYDPRNTTLKLTLWARKEIDIALHRAPQTEETTYDIRNPNSLENVLKSIRSYLKQHRLRT